LEIELVKLLILPGANELAQRGFATRANKSNREFCQPMLEIASQADPSLLEMMFDPQTSGGLLISVPEKNAQNLVDRINGQEQNFARIVGLVQPKGDRSLRIQ
jgi:selenide,water dikinase